LRKNIGAERQGKCQNIEIPYYLTPFTKNSSLAAAYRTCSNNSTPHPNYEEQNADYPKTLDLFPIKENEQDGSCLTERKSMFCVNASSMDTHEITSSNQFFEFLPLRN
jgi:hypothetical protein